MSNNLFLRKLRVRWALSQEELAQLLDIHQSSVSRYEQGTEYPPLSVALALQVIFGRLPHRVFAPLYASVEDQVMGRAAEFEPSVRGRSDPGAAKKRHLLRSMMERAISRREA